MSHEPECFYDGERDDDVWRDAEDQPCICDELQAAYQRGRDYERKMIGLDRLSDLAHSDEELEAAYRRGREDAAEAVGLLGSWLDKTVDFGDAIAAVRGDGDCQHDWQHLKGEKCATCRRCGAARGDGE